MTNPSPAMAPEFPNTELGAAARLRAARLALLALLLGAFATSLSGVFIKLSELPPTATAFYRVFLSAPLLFLWLQWERPRRKAAPQPATVKDYVDLVVMGLLFGCNTALWCWAMRYTSVANGQFIASMSPIFVSFGAFFLLRERFSANFLAGLALTILGVGSLMGQSFHLGGEHFLGDFLVLCGVTFWSAYLIATQRLRPRFSTATLMTWTTSVSALLLIVASWAAHEPLVPTTLAGWAALFGLAFISQVAGQGLITFAFAQLPASFIALVMLIQPIYAMAVAWPTLGEAPTLIQALGGTVILAGIVIARRGRR